MNITKEQLLLLYNVKVNNLHPVHKLINKNELDEILDNYSYHGELYSLPFLFFINEYYNGFVTCEYNNVVVAVIKIEDVYQIDHNEVCQKMFNTTDTSHPGVKTFYENEDKLVLSGTIEYFNFAEINKLNIPNIQNSVNEYVFQSRNPPHTAHEKIIKKYQGNLTYTTPYSTVNKNDYPFEAKIKCMEYMKEQYNLTLLTTTIPRLLAGPREALQNLLYFNNIGGKYFIMGRGKNCVGTFYGDLESYEFCKTFEDRLNIKMIYQDTIFESGKEIKASVIKKEYIDKGITPPEEFMNPEISKILLG